MHKFLFTLLLMPSWVFSADIFTQYKLNEQGLTNQYLAKVDVESKKVIHQTFLGISESETPLVVGQPGVQSVVALLQNGDDSDEVVLLDRDTLKEHNRITVPNVKWPLTDGLKLFPVHLSKDGERVTVISQTEEGLQLNIYSSKNGEVFYNRDFGNYPYQVTITDDENYLIFKGTSKNRPLFIVIDIINGKTTTLLNFGKQEVKTHVFENHVFLSKEMLGRKRNYYKLTQIDFLSNTENELETFSSSHFVFATSEKNQSLYILGKAHEGKKRLFMRTYADGKLSETYEYKKKSIPVEVIINENEDRLMVIGKHKLTTINLDDNSLQSFVSLPFDTLSGFMNRQGTVGYLQENEGSEIASIDLLKGKVIEEVGAGRTLVKVGQVLRQQTISYFVGGLIGALIETQFQKLLSSKDMVLNGNEDKLYVINSSSNDLTVFDSVSLEKLLILPTGFKTYFMYQGQTDKSILLTVGKNKISMIDSNINQKVTAFEDVSFLNLDPKSETLFYNNDSGFHLFDMMNRKELMMIDTFKPLAVYVLE